jgi:predicted ATPase
MLKKLTIRNFKAIEDMTIEFSPLTVLIGGNGCGKSTVLQALDFLRSVSFRDIPEYLREKGWDFEELKSQLNGENNKPIEFISVFEFTTTNGKLQKVEWDFSVDYQDGKWKICENISSNNEALLGIGNESRMVYGQQWNFPNFPFQGIKLESSSLKIMDDFFFTVAFGKEALLALRQYLSSSSYLGVISPDHIRMGEKSGYFDRFTAPGEMPLVRFINNLSKENKKNINDIVSNFIGHDFEIDTMFDKNQNLMLFARETNGNTHSVIHVSHISDGVLRFVVFATLAVQSGQNGGMVLLDEIEDGINPYMTEMAVEYLRKIIEDSGKQIVITTHSPVILNEFKPEEIVFLWKDKSGAVSGKSMFSTEKMKRTLKVLNPGEVWINYEKDEIIQRLKPDNEQEVIVK